MKQKKRGCYISSKRLSRFLRNPFYAGLIVSSIIPGEIHEGKHEKALSYKEFKDANDILDGKKCSRKGMSNKKNNENIPLRGTLICDDCGSNMTAYKATKNQKYYYKCSKIGCRNNQRAEEVHDSFREVLSYFQIEKKNIEPLKISLTNVFSELNIDSEIRRKELKATLRGIDVKLDNLEEKYLFESLSQQTYYKHLSRLTDEKNEILKEFEKPDMKLSNLDKYIDFSVNISSNILNMWSNEDYDQKLNIQKLLFPDGIRYNRKNNHYRTTRVNNIFAINNLFSEAYKDKNERGETIIYDFPSKVELRGVEPRSKQGSH